MNIPALITTEKKSDLPILIVDKTGIIGQKLAENIKQEALVILVSEKKIEDPNIIHVPFTKSIPVIPDNSYSHIFLIDENGVISKKMISPFLKKALHDESELVLVLRRDLAEKEFVENFINSQAHAKVVVTGDIFAKDFIFDPETNINRFIKQAKENRKIEIPGEGTRQTSAIYLEDAVMGILQAAFIEKDDEKIYLVYQKESWTLLALARVFQKIDPNLKIDFIKELQYTGENESIKGKYLIEENYDLESKIKNIDFEKEAFEEVKREDSKDPLFELSLPPLFNNLFIACVLTIIATLVLPILFTFLFGALGGIFLEGAKTQVRDGKIESAKNFIHASYYSFTLSESAYTLAQKQTKFIGLEKQASAYLNKIDQGREASLAALEFFGGIDKLKQVFFGSSKLSEKEFASVTNDIKSAIVFYQKQKENGQIPSSLDKSLEDIVNFSSSTIEIWPDLLGFRGKRKYLVLLQNNMELRPGGGFIGSFGVLNLDKGKVDDFKIYDVYDADGQLKGHIEPPFAVRRYLNSPNWYLRDSNFDIDFSNSAQASAAFLLSELKQPVDGVIALDLSFVKNLLSEIGEVKVADYNEVVNADNLFRVTQSKVETNFFPGSTQKKDFLGSLYKSIEKKITEDKSLPYLNILKSVTKSISEKHILFAFNKTSTEALFSVNGWGGTLFDDRSNTQEAINDFIGVNESNFGANKVNYYISRSAALNVSIKETGEIENTLKLSFKNNANKSMGTKGLYKNYLRFILPFGANVSKIEINGKEEKLVNAVIEPNLYEAEKFVPPQGLEVERQNQAGNSVIGFLVNIEPEELKSITIMYDLPKKLDITQGRIVYSLKVYKQPGIDSIPLSVSLDIPSSLKILDYPASATKKEKGATLVENITKDSIYNFILSRE